jgi:hypothetical protein
MTADAMDPHEFARRFEKACQIGDALLWPALLAMPALAQRTTGLANGMLLVVALLWGKRRMRRAMLAGIGLLPYRYTTWRVLKFFVWMLLAALVLVLKVRMDAL